LEIFNLFPGSWGSNCYVLISEDRHGRRHAAVVDPSAAAKAITELLRAQNAALEFIILTHGHFDHITALDTLREATGAPAYIHKGDAEMLTDGEKNAFKLFFGQERKWRPAERLLSDKDKLMLGDEEIEVISTPGHSKGSICLLTKDLIISGDTLFADGYGRYDLHGGNPDQLASSLKLLRKYDQNLKLYAGHGDMGTLGQALDNVLYY
jgi:glyoxylase-like metal-dependent hydrolase (beta-lactamase superfamily II)